VPQSDEAGANVADERERQLDPRSVTVNRLSGGIAMSILAVMGFIATLIVLLANSFGPLWALLLFGGWGALCIAMGAFVLVWPAVRYRHTFYRVSNRGIRIRRGVLWRSVHEVPRSRIQHTDVSQGPIERLFDLATLVIYTAGTEHASISLSGLPHESAMRIRDHLLEGGTGDAV